MLKGVRTETDSNGNPNVFNAYRNDDKPYLNANYANPENQWNLENELVLVRRKPFRFSPGRLVRTGGVLFYELSTPAAEHFADFIDFLGDGGIFIGV